MVKITMVIVGVPSPKDRVVGPLPYMASFWLINGGDPNHLLSGMILQVGDINPNRTSIQEVISISPPGSHTISPSFHPLNSNDVGFVGNCYCRVNLPLVQQSSTSSKYSSVGYILINSI